MNKIYYLQKHEVKLGDIIEYNGIKTVVTEELIEFNPELFRVEGNIHPIYFKSLKGIKPFTTGRVYKQVDSIGYPTTIKLIADDNKEWTIYNWQSDYLHLNNNCFELTTKEEWNKQELLDKAKRDYPAGTMFRSLFGKIYTVKNKPCYSLGAHSSILIDNTYVYRDGRWAEVLPLKFITEDGVDIYGDMKTYAICRDELILELPSVYGGNSPTLTYFYHKENALAYIEKHKEKTLEDYESNLFEIMQTNVYSSNNRHYYSVWSWIKDNEPKLYYSKILQLIADDLNDGWVANFTNHNEKKWFITKETVDFCYHIKIQSVVYFKLRDSAQKARDILGDKVNYLLN